MRILWVSNSPLQHTGYGKIHSELVPRLQKISDHDFVSFCVSGISNSMPFNVNGIRTYGSSSLGGMLGMNDIPALINIENIDLVHMNFDVWAVPNAVDNLSTPISVYPPIDHDPLPLGWQHVFNKVAKIAPYCHFGKRVIKEAGIPDDKVTAPIYHGVDYNTYKPMDVSKEKLFGVPEDTFVIGMAKNNQGNRWAPEVQLKAFRTFLEMDDVDDSKCMMYIHSMIQGQNSFDLQYLVTRLGLENHVRLVNQDQYRWGVGEDQMARLYSGMNLLSNCNRGEGFGLPIPEAFACGTPVLGSAFSSMPELILGKEGEINYFSIEKPVIDAERGLLVPTLNAEASLGKHSWRRNIKSTHVALAYKYAYQHQEEMKKKGKSAREWVVKNKLNWDIIAYKFKHFFDDLEDELFQEDEDTGIPWQKIQEDEIHGGVGGFKK